MLIYKNKCYDVHTCMLLLEVWKITFCFCIPDLKCNEMVINIQCTWVDVCI